MCCQFWTLRNISFVCPSCGQDGVDDLQTHWQGDMASCLNYYEINEPVEELSGIVEDTLPPEDYFIGECSSCHAWIDFGANIKDGKVTEVWPVKAEYVGNRYLGS